MQNFPIAKNNKKTIWNCFSKKTKDYYLSEEILANGIFVTATSGSGRYEFIENLLFAGSNAGYKFLVISKGVNVIAPKYCSIEKLNPKQRIRVITLGKHDEEQQSPLTEQPIHDDVVFFLYDSHTNDDQEVKKSIERIVQLCPEHIVIYAEVEENYIIEKNNNIIVSNRSIPHNLKTELFMRTENFHNTNFSEEKQNAIQSFNAGVFIDKENPENTYTVPFNKKRFKFYPFDETTINYI